MPKSYNYMDHQAPGVLGTIITISFSTVSIASLSPYVSFTAGLVAIIAGLTTVYKNTKKE